MKLPNALLLVLATAVIGAAGCETQSTPMTTAPGAKAELPTWARALSMMEAR